VLAVIVCEEMAGAIVPPSVFSDDYRVTVGRVSIFGYVSEPRSSGTERAEATTGGIRIRVIGQQIAERRRK
jgi:hypothetical protein